MISLKRSNAQGYLSLKGVFRISGQRNFTFPLGNKEYILVCSRFWDDKSLEVFVSEGGVNLLDVFTITNDQQFLESTQNNFLQLTLYKVSKTPQQDVIGLLSLPLHQFFIAYRDETITNRLCEEQFPVFSTDAWVPIINSVTREKIGEVKCLLAIGTEKQIESINKSSKLKDNGITLPLRATGDVLCNNKSLKVSQKSGSGPANAQSELLPQNANKTLDLLNILQNTIPKPSSKNLQTVDHLTDRHSIGGTFQVYLEIKSARGLPLNPSFKMKKKIKRNTSGKGRLLRFPSDEQPSTYVTFQADEANSILVKSHEGMVYSTDVIEKTSNPVWSKSYNISVTLDYLFNKKKRFILKIWRKTTTTSARCKPLPCPMEDSIIGFAAIDFTTFHGNVPLGSDWFNIVDFSGHINGQINVTAHLMDDLQKLADTMRHQHDNQVDLLLDSFESSLNINNMSLSRAIKRKFTELEEISHRLRVRLLDVTGRIDSEVDIEDIYDEQLDEFEHDLNTTACEDEKDNISDCTPTTSQSTSHLQ